MVPRTAREPESPSAPADDEDDCQILSNIFGAEAAKRGNSAQNHSWEEGGPCVGCVAGTQERRIPTQTITTSSFAEGEEEDWERRQTVMGRQLSHGRASARADTPRPASPAMEVPIPFATQSKKVSRSSPEAAALQSNFSSGNLWDRLSQPPSSHWMEEYHEAPPLLTSGGVARRGAAKTEAGPLLPWQVISTLEKLPSPKELCHRRRKGAKRKRPEDFRALSVFYHLEELKRRQNNIDEQKKMTWRPRVSQQGRDGAEGGPPGPPTQAACPEEVPLGPFSIPAAPELYQRQPVLHRYQEAELFCPEWTPSVKQQPAFCGESPVLSYTVATRERHPMPAARCLSEGDFWRFNLQPEE
uniref:Protein INCA1 n=1 Tax=Pogona vitticeps TaxID=103695 RepID=A0ABM5EJQ6_9SAUR